MPRDTRRRKFGGIQNLGTVDKQVRAKVSWCNFLFSAPMSAPSSLCSFLAPVKTQGADAAATTAPDIEVTLLAEEQQVQWDVEDLVKALEEANHKCEDLTKKRRDAQVAWEKHEAEQCEADVKVRGKLLANAAVAEVRHRFVCQADKARLAAEKLQAERDVSRSPCKVWMRLGVSAFFSLVIA